LLAVRAQGRSHRAHQADGIVALDLGDVWGLVVGLSGRNGGDGPFEQECRACHDVSIGHTDARDG